MAERKQITKKTRFEVFKRDRFTCQYCGRMSPDVILEVDHIKPVSKGGGNSLLNLITACRDCNRGKSDNKLSSDAEIKKQQKQLLDLADKREQLKMMLDWKDELLKFQKEQVDLIERLILEITGYTLNDTGRQVIFKFLNEFPFDYVWDATKVAFNKYYDNSHGEKLAERSFSEALNKIGGICYNKRKRKESE